MRNMSKTCVRYTYVKRMVYITYEGSLKSSWAHITFIEMTTLSEKHNI